MLEQYGHGGDLRTAEEIFGKQAGSFLDFSSNIRSAQGAPDAWFLGSPNNPTGMPVDGAIIELLLDSGSFVFLDEAFVDFLPDEADRSFAHRAAETRNLVVIRSMTKFYAVPGIRLGYAVGHPQTIAAMRELQIPWSVNTLAQEIGAAVLKDTAYGRRTIAWLREERPWLAGRLEALGLTVYPGAANYILFELPERFGMDAATLQRALGRQGILIRDASLFAGLNGRFCRVAVKLREQNERLIGTMKAIVDEAVSGGGGGEGRE